MTSESQSEYAADLNSKLRNLMDGSMSANHRYFHLQTLYNLIYHLDGVKTLSDKRWIYETLCSYFMAAEKFLPEIDRKSSKDLYFTYLDKIADYYDSNLDFSLMINWIFFIAIFTVLSVAAYFVIGIWISLAVVAFFIIRAFARYNKWKQNKVYCLFY